MFAGHGRLWRAANIRVTVISSPGPDLERFGIDEGVETVGLPMERGLSPLRDIVSLYRLWSEFQRLRPELVECGTPKAGLLGGIENGTALGGRLDWRESLLRSIHCMGFA